jgi:hypothetical protein
MSEGIIGHPERAADDYLSSYRDGAAKAHTTILSLAFSLVVAWISLIEVNFINTSELVDKKVEQQQESVRLKLKKEFIDRRKSKIINYASSQNSQIKFDKFSIRDASNGRFKDEFETLESNSIEVKAKIDSIAEEKSSVDFNALGATFSVPKKIIVIAWMLLFVGLLTFVTTKRETLAITLGKSVKKFNQSEQSSDSERSASVSDIAGVVPFWMSPIPVHSSLAGIDLRRAFGWDDSDFKSATIISLMANLALFLIAIRIIYLNFLLTDENEFVSFATNTDPWQRWTINFIVIFMFLLAALQAFRWLLPPLALASNQKFSEERRWIIGTPMIAMGSIVLTWPLGRLINWQTEVSSIVDENVEISANHLKKQPRRRMSKLVKYALPTEGIENPVPGFYQIAYSTSKDPKRSTEIVYLDDPSDPAISIKLQAKLDDGGSVSLVLLQTDALPFKQLGNDAAYGIERLAVAELASNRIDNAIKLLSTAVQQQFEQLPQQKPIKELHSFRRRILATRHIDLLATLYARTRRIDELIKLASSLRSFAEKLPATGSSTADKVALLARAQRWEAADKKWRSVRANAGNLIVWHYNARMKKEKGHLKL